MGGRDTKTRLRKLTVLPPSPSQNSTRRAYYKEVRKVVDAADVILHVLDARDPMGCRSREVEDMVLDAMADSSDPDASRKRLVLVLNKIDLVPLDALQVRCVV